MGKRIGGCSVLILCFALSAQQPQWQVPERGAVEYQRTWRAVSGVAGSAASLRRLEPGDAVPQRFLPRRVPAPVLCQGELDVGQRFIESPARDLRDVIRAVALDLAIRTRYSRRFPRVRPYGDLLVSGRVGRLDEEGWQEMVLTVARRPVAPLPGDTRNLRKQHVGPLCNCKLSGDLKLRRHVDRAAGLVREFAAELDLMLDEGAGMPERYRRIYIEDQWQLVAVHHNQDAQFRARVAGATQKAEGWLRQTLDGMSKSFLQDGRKKDRRSYGSGRIALATWTLLHTGVAADDPLVRDAFAELARRDLIDTYSLSMALVAMAQRYAPPRESERIRMGQLAARSGRQLPPRDQDLVTQWSERLLANLDPRVDPVEVARFTYAGGTWFDNSLMQYGLLGLDAAELCGFEVPPGIWRAAGSHLLAMQGVATRKGFGLRLTTHQELAEASGQPFTPGTIRTKTRGFAYQRPDEPAYGGMTAAGLAGLLLARAGCQRSGPAQGSGLRDLDQGIHAAFGWLASELTFRSNPGFVGKANHHWYYWLHAFERACELAGVAHLQGRDWYYEGAMQLLTQQRPDGSFRADREGTLLLDATCFAVLFLQKATVAASTPR